MNILHRPKLVVLGMMTKMPVAGVVWQAAHYLVGFQRLGYDVYYVEAHARTPSMFMQTETDDGSGMAAAFIDDVMRRFGLDGHWAYQALHEENGRCYGMSDSQLAELYREAALIINLHGGTEPRPEHYATGRLVYLETDPVELQIELFHNNKEAIEFLSPHCAFFTFGENYGNADCGLPISQRFKFRPTRQPVVMDFWKSEEIPDEGAATFTTIGNWQQNWRQVTFDGQIYHWSKHFEFKKFIDLPRRRPHERFTLALSSYEPNDKTMLESYGWHVTHAMDFSMDIDRYRDYVATSRGEFTVAKDQNVRLRSGWFSDRSATYLAAGRPVITQETGFSSILPTGAGLFGFSGMEDVLAAVDAIAVNPQAHRRAAAALAHEYFDASVVLGRLLQDLGEPPLPQGRRISQGIDGKDRDGEISLPRADPRAGGRDV